MVIRNHFYNLRFMLIVCVLVGNALEPLITRFAGAEALFLWIYTFHMPLFVWVTGYFARHAPQGAPGRKVLKQIALQYVLFQSLYALMDVTVFHTPHMKLSFCSLSVAVVSGQPLLLEASAQSYLIVEANLSAHCLRSAGSRGGLPACGRILAQLQPNVCISPFLHDRL